MPLGTLERLPRGRRIWEDVYADALERYGDDSRAAATAWHAVKGAGYYQDRAGTWRAPGNDVLAEWTAEPVGKFALRTRTEDEPAMVPTADHEPAFGRERMVPFGDGKFVLEVYDKYNRTTTILGAHRTQAAAKKAAGVYYRDRRTRTDPARREFVPVGVWGETEKQWRKRYDAILAKEQAKIDKALETCTLTWDERGTPGTSGYLASAQGAPYGPGRWDQTRYLLSWLEGYKKPSGYSLTYVYPPTARQMEGARRHGVDIPEREQGVWEDGSDQNYPDDRLIPTLAKAKRAAELHCRRVSGRPAPGEAKRSSGRSAGRKAAKPKPSGKRWRWSAYRQGGVATSYTPITTAGIMGEYGIHRTGLGELGAPGPKVWAVTKGTFRDDTYRTLAEGYATAADAKVAAQVHQETGSIPMPSAFAGAPKAKAKAKAKASSRAKAKPKRPMFKWQVENDTPADRREGRSPRHVLSLPGVDLVVGRGLAGWHVFRNLAGLPGDVLGDGFSSALAAKMAAETEARRLGHRPTAKAKAPPKAKAKASSRAKPKAKAPPKPKRKASKKMAKKQPSPYSVTITYRQLADGAVRTHTEELPVPRGGSHSSTQRLETSASKVWKRLHAAIRRGTGRGATLISSDIQRPHWSELGKFRPGDKVSFDIPATAFQMARFGVGVVEPGASAVVGELLVRVEGGLPTFINERYLTAGWDPRWAPKPAKAPKVSKAAAAARRKNPDAKPRMTSPRRVAMAVLANRRAEDGPTAVSEFSTKHGPSVAKAVKDLAGWGLVELVTQQKGVITARLTDEGYGFALGELEHRTFFPSPEGARPKAPPKRKPAKKRSSKAKKRSSSKQGKGDALRRMLNGD